MGPQINTVITVLHRMLIDRSYIKLAVMLELQPSKAHCLQ